MWSVCEQDGNNCMVPMDVMKQLSIYLHSKALGHPSIAAGFRGSQYCLKHKNRLTTDRCIVSVVGIDKVGEYLQLLWSKFSTQGLS